MTIAIRKRYEEEGVDNFYANCEDYENPHFAIIKGLLSEENLSEDLKILDLCCGSGQVTRCLPRCDVVGCDPYLKDQYVKATGNDCYAFSFDDIIAGKLTGKAFDMIICSFALHLCEMEKLPILLYQLSRITRELIIITPHKRPEVKDFFTMIDERIESRVRLRRYRSTI